MEVHVVTGPPCSGKTTYIMRHRKPGDMIIDCDLIAVALGADKRRDPSPLVELAARRASDAAFSAAVECKDSGLDADAWVAAPAAREEDRDRFRAMGLTVHELDVPKETCIARAIMNGSLPSRIEFIERYFAEKAEASRAGRG